MRRRRLISVATPWLMGIGLGTCAWAQHGGGHGVHPPMPDARLFVHLRWLDTNAGFTDVAVGVRSPSIPETLNQTVLAGGPRIVQYLPSAQLEQHAQDDPSGKGPAAVQLAIEGPTQVYRRWLTAGDPERNRLISYIGTWRFMAVEKAEQRDRLLKEFETEQTRPPTIRLSAVGSDAWHEVPMEVGAPRNVDALRCTVRVREFYPDYAMDRTTMTPTNQSDRKKNPAAFVEVELNGIKEARWVFAKFPEFAHQGTEQLPLRIVLDCPVESDARTPDFAVVSVAGGPLEVWTRVADKTTATALELDVRNEVPGTQYGFRVTRFVSKAQVTESYSAAVDGKGKPAVAIEYADAAGKPAKMWLGLGNFRRMETPKGPALIGFDDRPGNAGTHP